MFTEERKNKLADTLYERIRKNPAHRMKCPMCDNNDFKLADAYLRNDLQPDLSTMSLGGMSIPSIAIICSNCGFISQHAVGILCPLPKQLTPDEEFDQAFEEAGRK